MEWVGSSYDDLLSMPRAAQRKLGFGLHRVQNGTSPAAWKPMNVVGAGVMEIRARADGEFRLLYVAKFAECVYVLHAFQKKTQKTSPLDLALAQARFRSIRRARREV